MKLLLVLAILPLVACGRPDSRLDANGNPSCDNVDSSKVECYNPAAVINGIYKHVAVPNSLKSPYFPK